MKAKTFSQKWDTEEKINENAGIMGGVGSYGPKKEIYKKWWFWIIVIVVLYLLFILFGR